jgi:hypothetical protein
MQIKKAPQRAGLFYVSLRQQRILLFLFYCFFFSLFTFDLKAYLSAAALIL